MAVEVSFSKFIIDMIPYIILGVGYGCMLGKTRSDCLEEIHKFRLERLEESGANIAQTMTIMKTLDDIYGNCMRNDRFEFVDVKKLRKKRRNGRAKNNVKN